MSSPFPGMDPYLEDANLWPVFHHQLISCMHDFLLPGLVDRYEAEVRQQHYTCERHASMPGSGQEQSEDYLEVRNRQDGQLLTLVQVVSPACKTSPACRKVYLERRQEGKAQRASLVEIDLVLQGHPTLDYSRDGLPTWDYSVTVTRSNQPERYEIYTATLRKRLPRFRLPLAADDRDTVLDLQTVFSHCYDQGNFAAKINYQGDPPARVISHLAYRIWEREGREHGHDKDHWYRAISELKPWVEG